MAKQRFRRNLTLQCDMPCGLPSRVKHTLEKIGVIKLIQADCILDSREAALHKAAACLNTSS